MPVTHADIATIKTWLDSGEAVAVDVREDHEYEASHIADAIHIPKSRFDINALPDANAKTLVFYCAMGMRSQSVAEQLVANGIIDDAVNMSGGLSAWMEANYPLET